MNFRLIMAIREGKSLNVYNMPPILDKITLNSGTIGQAVTIEQIMLGTRHPT